MAKRKRDPIEFGSHKMPFDAPRCGNYGRWPQQGMLPRAERRAAKVNLRLAGKEITV
jgi:hypothetical protein